MTSFQEVTWSFGPRSEEMDSPCPLVFELGSAHRFLSDAAVWCDEMSFMAQFYCWWWTFPNAVGGRIGCRSLTGKITQCALCPYLHCYFRGGWFMEAQLRTVSSFFCLDVSVARFCKTSLTCLGPDSRPPSSVRVSGSVWAWIYFFCGKQPLSSEVIHMQTFTLIVSCWFNSIAGIQPKLSWNGGIIKSPVYVTEREKNIRN